MAGQPVAMLVDLVADLFITGTPKRISREAPVLILSYQGEKLTPGGGANAVANVAALGGRPLPLGRRRRRRARPGAARPISKPAGSTTGGILVRPGYRTPTKVRILGGGKHSIKQQIVRYDIEETLALTPGGARASLLRLLERWAGEARVAILSDYGYGAVEPAMLAPGARRPGRPGDAARGQPLPARRVRRPRRRHPQRGGGRGAPRRRDQATIRTAWSRPAAACASGWARASS